MCEWHGGTYAGNLPVKLAHPRSDGIDIVYVDACIQPVVQALNDCGLQTLNCCCGHGVRPGWIALEDGRHILIARDHAEMVRMGADFPALDGTRNAPLPRWLGWTLFGAYLLCWGGVLALGIWGALQRGVISP